MHYILFQRGSNAILFFIYDMHDITSYNVCKVNRYFVTSYLYDYFTILHCKVLIKYDFSNLFIDIKYTTSRNRYY